MNERLFRKKSIEKISSPEQLDAYIRVSNPGVWMLLSAIVILLIGVCVWGVLGHLDTTLSAVAIAKDGQVMVYVRAEDVGDIREGMSVTVGDIDCAVTSVGTEPLAVDDSFTEYALHVGALQKGEWVYAVTVSGTSADGVYTALIVTESVSPMSFIIN